MTNELLNAEDIALVGNKSLGVAMRSLNERQRRFVDYLLESGTSNISRAARAAGYSGNDNTIYVTASRLAHDPKIQAAIREESGRRLNTGSIMAVSRLLSIAESSIDQKTALRAIEMILNRTGLHATSEHKVDVTHRTGEEADMVKRVGQLATALGLDPSKLLGNIGYDMPLEKPKVVIDGEFEEVVEEPSSFAGLEDVL